MTNYSSTTTKLATPRFRVTGPNFVVVGSMPQRPGFEFDLNSGWPPPAGVEPINESARSVAEFLALHRLNAYRPETVFNRQHQRFLLLEPDLDPRSVSVRVVPADKAVPGMPVWKSLQDFRAAASRQQFPHAKVGVGAELFIVQWPRNFTVGFELNPASGEAELVAEYYAANRDNPAIAESPWDWYSQSLFLPELAPVVRQRAPEAA